MKVLILSLVFLALASATSLSSQFQAFEHKFGKTYKSSAERLTRFATFMKNVKAIEEHNKSGKSSYKKVINKFADMTPEEFNKVMNGYKNAPKPGTVFADVKDVKVEDLPASVDWRDKGAIRAVKHQGYCGSCRLLQQSNPSNPMCKLRLETQWWKSFQHNTSPPAHQMNSNAVGAEAVRDLFHNLDLSTLNFLVLPRKRIILTPQEIWVSLVIANIHPIQWIL